VSPFFLPLLSKGAFRSAVTFTSMVCSHRQTVFEIRNVYGLVAGSRVDGDLAPRDSVRRAYNLYLPTPSLYRPTNCVNCVAPCLDCWLEHVPTIRGGGGGGWGLDLVSSISMFDLSSRERATVPKFYFSHREEHLRTNGFPVVWHTL
jgi:hypothetical protein